MTARARRRFGGASLAAVLALQLGCAGGGLATTHYYTLGAPPAVATAGAGVAIGVEAFAVDPPYDQDRIVYRTSPAAAEVGFYNYHRWAAPLGRLIQQALVDGLRGAAGVGAIEPATSAGDYDARLGGRVRYVEQIDDPSGQSVRIAVELVLRDGGEVLWSETLEASTGGEMDEGADVARLLIASFARIVDDARRRVEGRLAGWTPGRAGP